MSRLQINVAKCWDFKGDEQPPYPTIEVTLSSAHRKTTAHLKVDTGFNGLVAVGRDTARKLRLTPRGTIPVRTATGQGEAPLYLVTVSQPDLAVTHTVLAIGSERSLAGRRLLEDRTWLLDCKVGKFCMITGAEGSY